MSSPVPENIFKNYSVLPMSSFLLFISTLGGRSKMGLGQPQKYEQTLKESRTNVQCEFGGLMPIFQSDHAWSMF